MFLCLPSTSDPVFPEFRESLKFRYGGAVEWTGTEGGGDEMIQGEGEGEGGEKRGSARPIGNRFLRDFGRIKVFLERFGKATGKSSQTLPVMPMVCEVDRYTHCRVCNTT